MNLYRSFGNLMETWVTEESACPDLLGNNAKEPLTPSSDMETNLRSESVDSGVETASCDMSIPATSRSVSTDNTEMDLFTPQGEGLSLASTPQSPVLSSPAPSSSSSPHISPSRAEQGSSALHTAEESLQRTDSQLLKEKPKPPTVEEVLRRRPRASFLPKRHASDLVRGRRSDNFVLRRTVNPSVPIRHMSEIYRRPLSESCDNQISESFVKESKELSPGLSYLEAVCQMLEGIARQQMQRQESQMETDALCKHQDVQASNTYNDSTIAEEDFAPCLPLENTENTELTYCKPQRWKPGHLRRKSASETNLSTLHLRKLNTDCRGQHMSTFDLREKEEEDHEKQLQRLEEEDTSKTKRNWRSKLSSLRRDVSFMSDTKSQQTQPSEKSSARRRLSQLFKRRGKSAST